MRSSTMRLAVLAAVLLVLVAAAGLWALSGRTPASSSSPGAASAPATSAPKPASDGPGAAAKPTTQAKPTQASQAKPDAKPTAVAQAKPDAKPDTPVDVDRARIVREATWTPGQLRSHFEKHGNEGPWASESVYDASARETVTAGTLFIYVDRESNAERLGFYDKSGNRFTSITQDGRRITTHFRPDRGESYVRGLTRSTYR